MYADLAPNDRRAQIAEIIRTQREAVEMAASEMPTNVDLRALAYNNLAYACCYEDWREDYDETFIETARGAITSLAELIPRGEWLPNPCRPRAGPLQFTRVRILASRRDY
jgi:hypothetical protein